MLKQPLVVSQNTDLIDRVGSHDKWDVQGQSVTAIGSHGSEHASATAVQADPCRAHKQLSRPTLQNRAELCAQRRHAYTVDKLHQWERTPSGLTR